MKLIRLQISLTLLLLFIAFRRKGLEFSRSLLGRIVMLLVILGVAKYDRWCAILVFAFFVLLAETSPLDINLYEGFVPDANLHTLGGVEETGKYNVAQTSSDVIGDGIAPGKVVGEVADDEALKQQFQSSFCVKNTLIGGKPLPAAVKFTGCIDNNPCDKSCKFTYSVSAGDEQLTVAEMLKPQNSTQLPPWQI